MAEPNDEPPAGAEEPRRRDVQTIVWWVFWLFVLALSLVSTVKSPGL